MYIPFRQYTSLSLSVSCAHCAGPPEACEFAFYEDPCQPPNHYCINHVTNLRSGQKLVERKYVYYHVFYKLQLIQTSRHEYILVIEKKFCNFSIKTYVVGTQINHFYEAVLLNSKINMFKLIDEGAYIGLCYCICKQRIFWNCTLPL